MRTKNDIIRRLVDAQHLTAPQARQAVQTVLDGIIEAVLTHERIELRRFGTFRIRRRAARMARNPRTNTAFPLSPRCTLTFVPSDMVAERVQTREFARDGGPDRIALRPDQPELLRVNEPAPGPVPVG